MGLLLSKGSFSRNNSSPMTLVAVDEARVHDLLGLIRKSQVPPEQESEPHSFEWPHSKAALANSYFAIVAICHQTTPMGERRVSGWVSGVRKYGWDYLKEKFLSAVVDDLRWSTPMHWANLSPNTLGDLYEDSADGRTLNRIAERTYLLNDIGTRFVADELNDIDTAFAGCDYR